MPRFTHLSDDNRLEIEHALKECVSLCQIAGKLGKHTSTITREIKARSVPSDKGAFGRVTNRCVHRFTCGKKQVCMDKPDCLKHCPACKWCNTACPGFVEELCAMLEKPPYVCNGCKDEAKCVLRKRYDIHKPAHADYRDTLETARQGANISDDECRQMDALLEPLVLRGQSIHHIVKNNPNHFNVHEKTIYRYIDQRVLRVKNGDLPRRCMLKPRKAKPVEHKIDAKCREGRTYQDFLAFLALNPGARVVEMDTVIGRVGGKVLLTLLFRDTGFMMAFLREHKDAQSVIDAFARLWLLAGPELHRALFQVLLTDNGTDFSNPLALELAPDATPRSRMFYCDPCASWQKGRVERNHEFLRMILPPGTSFDGLTQAHIDLALSHINSYTRPALNDKAPFDLFSFTYGPALLEKLGQRRIPANDILLKPSLLA